jgi:hypothetical protein
MPLPGRHHWLPERNGHIPTAQELPWLGDVGAKALWSSGTPATSDQSFAMWSAEGPDQMFAIAVSMVRSLKAATATIPALGADPVG